MCLACCLAAALLPPRARSYSLNTGLDDPYIFKAEVRDWFTSGSIRYRIASLTPASWWLPHQDKIYMGSTMDYRNLDSTLPVFSAEVRPLKWAAADFEVGDSRFSKGKAYIHNWMDGEKRALLFYNSTVWFSPDHRDYAESSARLTGTTRLYSANAYFRVYRTSVRALHDEYDVQHSLELSAGYSWYEDRLRITQGATILSVDIFPNPPPLGAIAGLDSRFNMTWQGWRVGLRERTRISKEWAFNAKFAFGPTMCYRGEGFWNLSSSSYGNLGSSRIRHKVTGQVLELSASAEWKFWQRFHLTAGYMGWYYRLTSGEQNTYYANGTRTTEQITEFDASRKGFFSSLSFKF
ncbi:MAG: hypothetical protein A3J79_07090 [Elusimicrobia bacterium RIFOXYB2_FULL_62_6]|nr:MAG: hypothetical protein A3J79_07090 [Elusimicrobia bacterium RIFOXYB2_FULL_62_6]